MVMDDKLIEEAQIRNRIATNCKIQRKNRLHFVYVYLWKQRQNRVDVRGQYPQMYISITSLVKQLMDMELIYSLINRHGVNLLCPTGLPV